MSSTTAALLGALIGALAGVAASVSAQLLTARAARLAAARHLVAEFVDALNAIIGDIHARRAGEDRGEGFESVLAGGVLVQRLHRLSIELNLHIPEDARRVCDRAVIDMQTALKMMTYAEDYSDEERDAARETAANQLADVRKSLERRLGHRWYRQ